MSTSTTTRVTSWPGPTRTPGLSLLPVGTPRATNASSSDGQHDVRTLLAVVLPILFGSILLLGLLYFVLSRHHRRSKRRAEENRREAAKLRRARCASAGYVFPSYPASEASGPVEFELRESRAYPYREDLARLERSDSYKTHSLPRKPPPAYEAFLAVETEELSDVGRDNGLLLSLNIAGFLYYTVWTLLTWAIRLPCLVLLLGLSLVGMATGPTRMTTNNPPAQPAMDAPPAAADPPPSPARQHFQNLCEIARVKPWRVSFSYWAKRSVPVGFILHFCSHLRTWFRQLVLAPATIFSDPFSTVAALVVYPVVWFALFVAMLIWIALRLLGGRKIIEAVSRNWAAGLSIPNWPNPDMLGVDAKKAVDEARVYLAGDVPTTLPQQASQLDVDPDFTGLKTVRIFSIPLARTLLFMSSIVYERPDHLVQRAAELAVKAKSSYLPASVQYRDMMEQARDTLIQSGQPIKDKVAVWGLEFDGVSELTTVAGPFASIFYTKSGQKPFICLVFKGTTPTDYAEWLQNLTVTRTGASVFFGGGSGTVHDGFYTSLFMTTDESKAEVDGYGNSILRTLRHVAARMKRDANDKDLKIPLWCTGHSLGGALASLFYARLLHSPGDLEPDLQVKDCYVFGAPRLADGFFVSTFEASMLNPLDRPNILWRVLNGLDIVGNNPPGFADVESYRTTPSTSSLNYGYLGPAIRLLRYLPPLTRPPWYRVEQVGAFHERTEVRVVDHPSREATPADNGWRTRSARWTSIKAAPTNPLRWLAALLVPTPVYDHAPHSYLQHLNNMMTTEEQVAAGVGGGSA
ncbi:hypothetical protein JCM8097_001663 [Rhodosporidiobolus ruineniae]